MFVSTFSHCQIYLHTEIALILFVYGVFLSEGAVPGLKDADLTLRSDCSDNIQKFDFRRPKQLNAGNALSSNGKILLFSVLRPAVKQNEPMFQF